MFVSSKSTGWTEGREQAKANAAYFRRSYRVFSDTNGNIRVERHLPTDKLPPGSEVYSPEDFRE